MSAYPPRGGFGRGGAYSQRLPPPGPQYNNYGPPQLPGQPGGYDRRFQAQPMYPQGRGPMPMGRPMGGGPRGMPMRGGPMGRGPPRGYQDNYGMSDLSRGVGNMSMGPQGGMRRPPPMRGGYGPGPRGNGMGMGMGMGMGQRPPPGGGPVPGMGGPGPGMGGPPPDLPGDNYGPQSDAGFPPQQDEYGAPQQDQYGAPQQDQYGAPQQDQYGEPQQDQYGSLGGYGSDNFGPPQRSNTMPPSDEMNTPPPGPGGPGGPGGPHGGFGGMPPPPRPNTAQDPRMRDNSGTVPQESYDPATSRNSAEPAYDGQRPGSFGDLYDNYYEPNAGNNAGQPGQYPPPGQSDYNNQGYDQQNYDSQGYDYGAQGYGGNNSRGQDSYGQPRQAGPPELAQRGPGRVAELNRAKSQPDLRNSQAAVFEMAGDIPPMPSGRLSQQKPDDISPGNYARSPMSQQSYQGSPLGQQGPPPPGPGLPPHPAPYRSNTMTSQSYSSDSLPSHPAPVRPGLMPNSLVNLSDRPPPVRHYSGSTYNGSIQSPSPSSASSSTLPTQAIPTPPMSKPVEGPVTVEELEHLRALIKRDANDQASALRLAKKLVEASDVLVPNIPDQKARARSREHYLMDAHKILKKLEKASNPDAMFFFADCLGRGVFSPEPDTAHAFSLYQSAAKLGHPAAAYRTAVCCEIGHDEGGGTRKDPLKAIQWYKRAATLGDPPAMYKVGMILLKGLLGQPVNPREAVSWLKRAAERADTENPHALHELALLYMDTSRNDIVIPDEAYALRLFTQAGNLGYKFSQFQLGVAWEYGKLGCHIDVEESIKWYSLAAKQGEHQSELALSGWYLTGATKKLRPDGPEVEVLAVNLTEAYLWAKKAAAAGLERAEFAMGWYLENGYGVGRNIEDAKRWYWRAAAQGNKKAREQLEILKRTGGKGMQQQERISRSKIAKEGKDGDCVVM